MAKKEIEIILKKAQEVFKYQAWAIVNQDSIKYNENDLKVILKFNHHNTILIRENSEYQLKLIFEKDKKTRGSYLLKENNMVLDLDIFTKQLEIALNKIKIVYELYDNIYEYTVNIRE